MTVCLIDRRYEPYVVLAKSKDLPSYSEKFSGYGKNKIQVPPP